MTRILLLGGSSEASALAAALARLEMDAVFSYAGRTRHPIPQPLPTRIGGFGGVAGLETYLAREAITHLVDATHPFAAGMSRNAVAAAQKLGLPLLALERPPWSASPGDRWRLVPDVAAAVRDLPDRPARIFLAIGRQNLAPFAARPEHHYLLRLVDAPQVEAPVPLASFDVVVSRGPFTPDGDVALMRERQIESVVSKNAGGAQAGAKIAAARTLGLPVTMIARPDIPQRPIVTTVDDALAWLGLRSTTQHTHHVSRLGV